MPSCGLHHFAAAAWDKISAPSLDWHNVISLSSIGITLKGRVPWQLGACGEMLGCRQALVFLIETGPKKKKICHFLIQYLGDLWRPVSATFPSFNMPSQNYLRHPLAGVSAPALKEELCFQIVINLQMLCKSICLHLHITSVHVCMCVHVDAFNTEVCKGPYKLCLWCAD